MTAHDDAWIQGLARDPAEPTAERIDETTGEILDTDAPDNGGWDKERHCITDLRGVDWAGRKLREAQDQIALNEEMAEDEIAVLNRKMLAVRERLKRADAPFAASVEYFQNALTVYASTPEGKAEVLKGLRKKSRLLPCGVTIGWRTQKAGYRWDQRPGPDGRPPTPAQNQERLLAWVGNEERITGLVLTKPNPRPDLDAVKRHLVEMGNAGGDHELPPGLEYVPAGETLTVSVGEGESK